MHHLPKSVQPVHHDVVEDEHRIEGGKRHNSHVPVGSAQHGVDVVVEGLQRVILGCICCPPFVAEDSIVVVAGEEIEESLLVLDNVVHEILVDGGVVGWGVRCCGEGSPSRARPVRPWCNVEEDTGI